MYRPTYINIHPTCSAALAPWNVSAELLQPGLGPRWHHPSLLPTLGPGQEWQQHQHHPKWQIWKRPGLSQGLPMVRGTSTRVVCGCQPWNHPHSLHIQTYKTVNKSTLWGHCDRVLQAGHSGEARWSQGLENKLYSTAGWALPRCRCSFHNSPEVRRARRGRREGERSTASRG